MCPALTQQLPGHGDVPRVLGEGLGHPGNSGQWLLPDLYGSILLCYHQEMHPTKDQPHL